MYTAHDDYLCNTNYVIVKYMTRVVIVHVQ